MISIAVGLIKFKAVALILGPAGVGVIGLMLNIVGTISSIGGLGLATVGTREIAMALANGDDRLIAKVRHAILYAVFGLALITACSVAVAQGPLASWFGNGSISRADIVWLGVTAGVTIMAGAQTAMLNGFRQIGNLARLTIIGSIFGTVAGLTAVTLYGQKGVLLFVISAPIINLLVGQLFVSRLPKAPKVGVPLSELYRRWRSMAGIGAGLMATSLAGSGGPLIVRSFLETHAGPEALGQFQASWMISMNYLSFVLVAMGTDFFPRLSSAIHDHPLANSLVNEQMTVALLLVGPMLTGIIAFSPLIVHILYAESFLPASGVLRWQVVGDLFKVVSWPLGIIVLASGKSFTAFVLEATGMAAFAIATIVLLPFAGIAATGFAFIILYVFYLPLVYLSAHRLTGFTFSRLNIALITGTLALVVTTALIGNHSANAGMATGAVIGVAMGVYSVRKIALITGIDLRTALDTLLRRVSRR